MCNSKADVSVAEGCSCAAMTSLCDDVDSTSLHPCFVPGWAPGEERSRYAVYHQVLECDGAQPYSLDMAALASNRLPGA